MKTLLKIIGVIVFLGLVFLAIMYLKTPQNSVAVTTTPSSTTPVIAGSVPLGTQTPGTNPIQIVAPINANYLTYTDSVNSISYKYPTNMTLQSFTTSSGTQSWSINSSTGGTLISEAVLDKSFEPSTNFQGATFTVGSSTNSTSIAQCMTAQQGETTLGTLLINGVLFSKFNLDDAGAGNFYDTTSYRTVYDNTCYVVEYTIHTTNIGNYDPSQGISNYNKAPIVTLLESVAQSFKFLK